jgi:hypothetical protein
MRFGNDKIGENTGILGINLHYLPNSFITEMLRLLIIKDPRNRINFKNNDDLIIDQKFFSKYVYGKIKAYSGFHQYLPSGIYEKGKNGTTVSAGYTNVVQVSYARIVQYIIDRDTIAGPDFFVSDGKMSKFEKKKLSRSLFKPSYHQQLPKELKEILKHKINK